MKKIPPWAWMIGVVGVGGAFYLYKKSKESKELAESSNTSSTEANTEVPFSYGEGPEGYPYSMGGGGGGYGGALGNANETQSEFHELFGNLQTFEKESTGQQGEFDKGIASQIAESNKSVSEILKTFGSGGTAGAGSGGGAPSSPPPGGVTTAPPPPTAAPSCPAAFPDHNSANGAPGPHSCYKYSRERCNNKAQPYKHVYQDGHFDCAAS